MAKKALRKDAEKVLTPRMTVNLMLLHLPLLSRVVQDRVVHTYEIIAFMR